MLCPEKSQLQRLRHSLHSTEYPLTQWTYWCAICVRAKWKQNSEDRLAANHLTRSLTIRGARIYILTRQADPCWGSWPWAILSQEHNTPSPERLGFECRWTRHEAALPPKIPSDSNSEKRKNIKSSKRKNIQGNAHRVDFSAQVFRRSAMIHFKC